MTPPASPQESNEKEHDPLDSVLEEWGARITCSSEHANAMWSRVAETLANPLTKGSEEPGVFTPEIRRTRFDVVANWREIALWVAALAACFVAWFGFGAYLARYSARESAVEISSSTPSSTSPWMQFAFTSDELHANQSLACEVSSLYQKPVVVQRTPAGWDIDAEPGSEDTDTSQPIHRMLLRCVMLQASAAPPSGGVTWREVRREEFISGHEHQFALQGDHAAPLSAWTHLLPDKQLWAEFLDAEGGRSQMIQPNQPAVVWEGNQNELPCRVVLVYALLPPCDAGAML